MYQLGAIGVFGLHAETIRGKMDEKADTLTERVVKGGERERTEGCLGTCVCYIDGKYAHNKQNKTTFVLLCESGLLERETENP